MFIFYGLVLAGYGLFSQNDKAMYERSLGINTNLGWAWCCAPLVS